MERLYIVFIVLAIATILLLSHKQMIHPIKSREGGIAYAIFLENDKYITGALTLANCIKKYAYKHQEFDMIAIYLELDDNAKCSLTNAGWALNKVPLIAPFKEGAAEQFHNQYTKLSLWNFDNYDFIMYLDCDTLIRKSVDFLFDIMATGYDLGVVGDIHPGGFRTTFNAGMMILRPNKTVFRSFITEGPKLDYDPTMAEQEFLNTWYRNKVIRFPYVYSLNTAFLNFRDNKFIWNGLMTQCYIIHFTMCKPMKESCGSEIDTIWKEAEVVGTDCNTTH